MTASSTVAIVGAGQGGFQVAASLRELGFAGTIRLYGDERWLPYQRPPLSKSWLKEAPIHDKLYFRAPAFYADKHIEIQTSCPVTAIDRDARTLTLASGVTQRWDHLVLATGVENRRLTVPGADLAGVVTLRGLDDADAIRPRLAAAGRIVIVGGGVIGLEVGALARSLGLEVDIVELGDRLIGRIGTPTLCDYFLHFHRGIGARVHLGQSVARLEGRDGHVAAAVLADGRGLEAPLVLVSIGVTPATGLAVAAGLKVEDGIVVDEHMRTSDPAILAIGDCAKFRPPFSAKGRANGLVRLESVQNAIDQGKCAAHTIVGQPRPYDALPWFWSDQGTAKLQIAGLCLGHDRAIVKTDPAKGAMSVFVFAGDDLIAVECVNRPADFLAARRVLAARKTVRPADVESPVFELKAFM